MTKESFTATPAKASIPKNCLLAILRRFRNVALGLEGKASVAAHSRQFRRKLLRDFNEVNRFVHRLCAVTNDFRAIVPFDE